MPLPRLALLALLCLLVFPRAFTAAEPVVAPTADARRLEVMFLGAPTANGPFHDPITRYRVLKKALGVSGINLTYSENLDEAFATGFLNQFDALLMYANWNTLTPAHEQALLKYIESGRGFLPIHCASACFGHSDPFIALVGARFRRHGGEVFAPVTVLPDHPIMRDVGPLEAWDETYVHDRHNEDRTVLQVRRDPAGDEPWTWVRTHGAGRIFYTASGHDHRVWDQPEFQALLKNAIHWAVSDEARQKLTRLGMPELPQQDVLMPGYKLRQAITKAQVALAPAESAKLIQVPPGFEVSLFAAEPDIVNPIYVGWDHRGRAFVIETIDYPNNLQDGNLGHDRIKICEDTDGDGRADKFTVFADRLSVPTSLTFARGGVICTNGTQMLFLQDTNGDDVADVREVLIEGFSMRDTHAGPSNLRPGFDNWIYATIGYSGFAGEVGGQHHEFAQGLFRFTADGKRLEYLQPTTNNTWGLGFTEEFHILGSTANGNPSWVYTLPAERYRAFGITPPRTPRADDNPFFYPSSMDIRQVDVHDKYTAGAGHAFYTATRFPPEYRNRMAFVTEPTGKLIGQFDVAPAGATFTARQRPNNIFNSADAWTSPVCAEVGPDGALWVCDWYNLIIQHNPTPSVGSAGMDAERGKGAAYATPLRDVGHGRIWRVYPKNSNNDTDPKLDPARPETLVAALEHPNLLWRQHAQRLLVEGGHRPVAARLRSMAQGPGPGAVHALQALAGLGQVDRELLMLAAGSSQFAVRRGARDLAASTFPDVVLQQAKAVLDGGMPPGGAREWAEIMAALSHLESSTAVGQSILRAAVAHEAALIKDPMMVDSWQIAARQHASGVIEAALAANLPLEQADQRLAGQVLAVIAWNAGADPAKRAALTAAARQLDNAFARYVVAGLSTAPASAGTPARQFAVDPVVHQRGAQVYANTCVACHGLDGKGVAGAFPPLADSEWVSGDPAVPIKIVLHGLLGPIKVGGVEFNSAMPPVVGLSDADIASVLTFVRQQFNNDAAPVSEEQVRTTRMETRARREMWTAEQLGMTSAAP